MELALDEGRVYGARYHTAHPLFLFHSEMYTWRDMECWCTEIFGPTSADGVWTPNMRWYMNNSKFWFRNEADRTFFILRWS